MSESLKKRQSPSGFERLSHSLWFVATDKTLSGPFTVEEILSKISTGELDEGSYGWKQGYGEWRPICSIPDFNIAIKPYIVQPYPKIALPSAAPRRLRRSRRPARMHPSTRMPWNEQEEDRRKPVRVQLQRQNTWNVGNKERIFMGIFCILIAWFSGTLALNQVHKQFQIQMQKQHVGEWVKVDAQHLAQNEAWHMSWLDPIKSAPGLHNSVAEKAWPIRIQTKRLVQNADQDRAPWRHEDYKVKWSSPRPYGGFRFAGEADPIYSQPLEIYVEWSASEPHSLKARTPGYPGL